jgi:hypothetical protein
MYVCLINVSVYSRVKIVKVIMEMYLASDGCDVRYTEARMYGMKAVLVLVLHAGVGACADAGAGSCWS